MSQADQVMNLKIKRDGICRTVLLVGQLAIKFPATRNGYRLFLTGLLANCQERAWWRDTGHNVRLCPVLFGSRFGFWLVMRRAADIADDELPERDDFQGLPLDYKSDNFGRLGDRIVLRDYGS